MWNLDLERITKGNRGLAGVFLAGVVGQLATEGAGVESMPGLRGGSCWWGRGAWLWENARSLSLLAVANSHGWCNLNYVTQPKILEATYYSWLNPFSTEKANLLLLVTKNAE